MFSNYNGRKLMCLNYLAQCMIIGETLAIDLNSLVHALQGQFSSKWYSFGLAIGVPKEMLNQLKHHSDDGCLVEVLDHWLKNHPSKPTWEEVIEAKRKVSCNTNL